MGIHFFFGWRIFSHGLAVRKRLCLENRRRTAYSICPKFFSSCLDSGGIIILLSPEFFGGVLVVFLKMEDGFYGV